MAKKLQLRGGTTSEHSSFTGAVRQGHSCSTRWFYCWWYSTG